MGAVLGIGSGGPQSTGLIERFNGRRWSVALRLPDTVSALDAVSCVSTSFCLAVGYDGAFPAPTLALRWNGHAWSRVPSSSPSSGGEGDDLLAVDCISQRDCWAVGDSNLDAIGTPVSSLIEHFGGGALHEVAAPDSATGLSTIGCPSATSCYATADTGELERFGGAHWRLVPAPAPPGGNAETITCRTLSTCWILAASPSTGALVALHLSRGGFRAAPTRPTSTAVSPLGSDCAAARDCWWVGASVTGPLMPSFSPLAEHWDGSRWAAVATRSGYAGDAELTAVSCAPAGPCVAVGHSLLDATTTALVAVIDPG